MKPVVLIAPVLMLAACGGDAEPADETAMVDGATESASAAVADAEAVARRDSMIATWSAQFSLTEEQASCLVDTVAWENLIAAEQSADTVEQITGCGADPATFAGYGT